jgi:single-stranded DNA-binding protein
MVTGRLRQCSWETPEGERRSVTELKADDVGASLKVGHGQVERSAQRGTATAPRVSCPRVVATHQRFFGHSLALLPED